MKQYLPEEFYENNIKFNLKILEINLNILYHSIYKEKENPINSEVLIASLNQIGCQIFEIANQNITNSIREIDDFYIQELAYNYFKILKIMADTLTDFTNKYNLSADRAMEIMQEKMIPMRTQYNEKVSDMIQFNRMKTKIKDEQQLQEVCEWAKQGELMEHTKTLETFGIDILDTSTQRYALIWEEFLNYQKSTKKEFANPTQWDNDYVTKIMEQLWNEREVVDAAKLGEEFDSKTKLEKIKDFIAQFKNRKLKRLGTSEEKYKDLNDYLDERYKVSPENLKPMENRKNENHHSPNQERE